MLKGSAIASAGISRQSILQRYGEPKCNYEQAGSLIGLDIGIKTGVRGIGRYRASDLY